MKKILFTCVIAFVISSFVSAQSVRGNTDGIDSSLLSALRSYARLVGHDITLNWSGRTNKEQQALWDKYLNDGGHLSNNCPGEPTCHIKGRGGNAVHGKNGVTEVAKPGTSKHELGLAADIAGLTFSDCELLNQAGLCHTVSTESWHVESGSRCINHGR
jgi:hypothetical protein